MTYFLSSLPLSAGAAGCDINGDNSTNISDVQLCVNQAIGITACSTGDIDGNGQCNVVDVQRVVNAALGGQCIGVTPPPPPPPSSGDFCATFPALPSVRPDATNTGVPAGTTLTASGDITVTVAGTVINAKDVNGQITINANNVTIQNSKVHGTGSSYYAIKVADTVTGVKILHSTLYTTGGGYEGIYGGPFTACANDISGFENGMTIVDDNSIAQANYIHNLNSAQSGPHYDGIEVYGGNNGMCWGNNILMTDINGAWLDETGAINLTATWTNMDTNDIRGNWLDGGGFSLYVDEQSGNQASNVTVVNNRFGRHYQWDTHLIRRDASVTTWTGNVFDDNGQTVAK